MGATLDFLSDGRYRLGIGAGSSALEEYRPFGFPMIPFPDRVTRLRESLEVIQQFWENDQCEFDGEHFEIRGASLSPRPIQKPRPPVFVGGQSGELMELAANYEGWNIGFDLPPDTCANFVEEFRRNSKSAKADQNKIVSIGILLVTADTSPQVDEQVSKMARQRDLSIEEFRREYAASFVGTPDQLHDKVQAYLDAGIDEFFLWGPSVRDSQALESFSNEIIQDVG